MKQNAHTYENIAVDKLKPYEKNPRKNEEAVKYVAESIKEFGFKSPIIIDKNNVIVAGHTRYKAAKKLKLKSVPVIIANDLTDEQIKAFRIADNKVGEVAEWDIELLNGELSELNFDMEKFGFENLETGSVQDIDDFEIEEVDYKEKTQERRANILNLEVAQFKGAGQYEIPQIAPISAGEIGKVSEFIGFNYVMSDDNPEGKGVHFFIDDYQFERVWNNPERYIDKLRQYQVVLTPDFSPYGDMPMATQIYNHYRKHWLGAFWQQNGINVIPTVRASTNPRSLEWYLDGEPSGGVVCISNMWTSDKAGKDYFLNKEFKMMKERLNPEKIYVYGHKMKELNDVEYIPSFADKRWNNG